MGRSEVERHGAVPVGDVGDTGGKLEQSTTHQGDEAEALQGMGDASDWGIGEKIRIDDPQLRQQQGNGDDPGEDMNALGNPEEVDGAHGKVEPVWRVLGEIIHHAGEEAHGEADAEHDAHDRSQPFAVQRAVEAPLDPGHLDFRPRHDRSGQPAQAVLQPCVRCSSLAPAPAGDPSTRPERHGDCGALALWTRHRHGPTVPPGLASIAFEDLTKREIDGDDPLARHSSAARPGCNQLLSSAAPPAKGTFFRLAVSMSSSSTCPGTISRPVVTQGSSILVVDDEDVVRDVVVRYLDHEGMQTAQAADGEEARRIIEVDPPDLVILDVMLPKVNGLDLCTWIRDRSDIPVILLTARGEESDRITGLELGADDYVVKPFSPRELVIRVKAILRRTGSRQRRSPEVLEVAGLTLNGRSRQVHRAGSEITLTATEFDLLYCLASHPHMVFSREQLMAQVWRYEAALDAGTSTVTVHVRRLREKIEEDPSDPRIIITIWGVGYRFEA